MSRTRSYRAAPADKSSSLLRLKIFCFHCRPTQVIEINCFPEKKEQWLRSPRKKFSQLYSHPYGLSDTRPIALAGTRVMNRMSVEGTAPVRHAEVACFGDEPQGPGPDRGCAANAVAPSGRARTPAGHGKPRHVNNLRGVGPVPRFPPSMARLRKQGVAMMERDYPLPRNGGEVARS
jgi:hypothetical protein